MICCYRWEASRVEVETAPVNHVCAKEDAHFGEHRCSCGATPPLRTKTGRILTDADIEALADEAEQGYDVSQLRERQRP